MSPTPATYKVILHFANPLDSDTDFDGVLDALFVALGEPDTLDDIEWYPQSCDFWIDTADPQAVIAVATEVFARHGLTGTWRATPVADGCE